MKRLLLIVLSVFILLAAPSWAATNPFGEGTVAISQSATAVGNAESTALSKDVAKLEKSLAEANKKYSELLREFAANPEKYGDKNGDYRDFVKQLTALAKRLGAVKDKLVTLTAEAKKQEQAQKAKEDKEKAAAKPKTTPGTVKVSPSLNVRTGPWGKIIGSLHNNNKVKIIGTEGDWYKIDYNGQTAYIHANYVETANKKAGTTPVKQPGTSSTSSSSTPNVVQKGGGFTASPCSPMPTRVSSEYGWRVHPTLKTRKFHNGIDLPVPTGTRLNALGNGTVVAVGHENGGGNYIKVRYDNGLESFYCHLQKSTVKKGQRVNAGQEIAKSDNTGIYTTGAHLHMEIRKNGKAIDPRSVGLKLPPRR
ncbi:MAG: hypothetical protein CVV42_00900 [Candidatus Riflebacteria bacterium HGW-Riflebacteria-2]|jgi:murein DD-endopeptidase MepM/ murein hydrolase activator NlpD|nr:MAG: hypothetical protein CVV42_00900 [Candidatus Riflebacteria bacterium HGW-Riflebacteria-2]